MTRSSRSSRSLIWRSVAAGDHLRPRDAELEALAAHLLDEDGEVQLAAAADLDAVRAAEVLHAERDVDAQLALQPVLDLAQRRGAAVLAGERAVVDEEEHRDGGLFDLERRQGCAGRLHLGRRQRVAEADLVGAGEPGDVAGGDLVDLTVLEATPHPEVRHARRRRAGELPAGVRIADLEVPGRDALQLVADLEAAGEHAPAADAADVVAPGQRADLHEERRILVDLRRRDTADDGLEEVVHTGVGQLLDQRRRGRPAVGDVRLALSLFLLVFVQVVDDPAFEAGAVQHREIELLVVRAELDEEVEGLVECAGGVCVGPVGLVDDDDRPQPEPERSHEHVARLGHGALVGVDQQQHRVDHAEHTLHLAAEIGVARRVDDVDQVLLPLHRAVLGADGDAALALEVVAVHHTLVDVGALAEHVGGAEDAVDQRRLAVIDVGDDGQVADLFSGVHGRGLSVGDD